MVTGLALPELALQCKQRIVIYVEISCSKMQYSGAQDEIQSPHLNLFKG